MNTATTLLDAETVNAKLTSDQLFLEKALVALYMKQTLDEQRNEATHHQNNVGFNSADARKCSYCAAWVKSGRHLSGRFLGDMKKRLPKYAKQVAYLYNNEPHLFAQ